jgi:KDO2-lipid IV(A) lauroyltransferase
MLNRILYHFLVRPFSYLPFAVLFVFSKLIYYIIFYIFPYRRKVVRANLALAFPMLSPARRRAAEKGFYLWFTQLVIEIMKCFSGNVRFLEKRCRFENPECILKALEEGRHVMMLTSHYGNWEWGSLAMGMKFPDRVMGVYLPMKSHFWNQRFKKMRAQTGNHMVPAREVGLAMKTSPRPMIWCFAADQTPAGPARSPWLHFMGVPAPWIDGPERLSQVHKTMVVYGHIRRVRRGSYEVRFVPFEGDIREPGAITRFAVKSLEDDLHKKPEHWLWSHRRWKHQADKFNRIRWI